MNHTYIIEARSRYTGIIKYYTGRVYHSSVELLGKVGACMRRLMQHRYGKGAKCLRGYDLLRMVISDHYPESDFKDVHRGGKTIRRAKYNRGNKSMFVDQAFEFYTLNDDQYSMACSGKGSPSMVPRFVPFWKSCEHCKGIGSGKKGFGCPETHPEYGLSPNKPGDYWCVFCDGKGGIGIGDFKEPVKEWYRQDVLSRISEHARRMVNREERRRSKP